MNALRHTLCGTLVAAVILMSATGSGAYGIQHGAGDWARMAYNADSPDGHIFVFVSVVQWGTEYYGGIPPQNNGGLGDGHVCLSFATSSPVQDVHGDGCKDGAGALIDSLTTVTIADSFELELTDGDGTPLGTETAVAQITMTGKGLIYPGARVATNPGPGVELEYQLMRNAVVSGTVSSPSLGTVDLAGTPATLERANCIGAAIEDSDSIQACRFN